LAPAVINRSALPVDPIRKSLTPPATGAAKSPAKRCFDESASRPISTLGYWRKKAKKSGSSQPIERGPLIFGEFDPIRNIPADRKPCETRDGKGLDDYIAEIQTCPRPGRKSASKALGAALFGIDIAAQLSLIARKCLLISALRRAEFAGQHIGRDHRQRRALDGQQRDAERRISHILIGIEEVSSASDLREFVQGSNRR
jgi:hypothetical protein